MVLAAPVMVLLGLTFVSAAINALYLGRYALRTSRPARRVGSAALAGLSAALTSECLLFGTLVLARGERFLDGAASAAALLAVRAFLLAASCFVSLLIWRQHGDGRGGIQR
jgi:hypothetical protein